MTDRPRRIGWDWLLLGCAALAPGCGAPAPLAGPRDEPSLNSRERVEWRVLADGDEIVVGRYRLPFLVHAGASAEHGPVGGVECSIPLENAEQQQRECGRTEGRAWKPPAAAVGDFPEEAATPS